MGEWYYIGHYGQLGPLTREQMDDLIQGGVIVRETYIWKAGMASWQRAESTPELQNTFAAMQPATPPPPPPPTPQHPPPLTAPPMYMTDLVTSPYGRTGHPMIVTTRSDKSRVLGGLLQVIPGIGRIYLGHIAIGVLQLVLSPCMVGVIWSWIDGLYILAGGMKLDGYGRLLKE